MRALAARGLRLVARVAGHLATRLDPWHIDVPSQDDDVKGDGFELVNAEDRPTHPDGFALELDPLNTIKSPPEEQPLEGSLAARTRRQW